MSDHLSDEQLSALWDRFDRPAAGSHYRHYKGGIYEIVATGFLEASETPCVIYRPLKKQTIWVRTTQNFLEAVEYDGQTLPRFTKLT